jgi:hypothetical protein
VDGLDRGQVDLGRVVQDREKLTTSMLGINRVVDVTNASVLYEKPLRSPSTASRRGFERRPSAAGSWWLRPTAATTRSTSTRTASRPTPASRH